MSDTVEATSTVRSALALLLGYARIKRRPFSEVAREYVILLQPTPTDVEGMIRYLESLARLQGDLATFYSGPPVFEGKGNQRKLLILRYFSERECATSLDVPSHMNLSLTNTSERLRRYYKQGLLTRIALVRRKRGRRTMVYKLTDAGRRRLAFLEKNVKFKRAETDASKKYRSRQLTVEKIERILHQQLASPPNS
jgi:DNA-binding MarR family transcriptional regulator